MLCASLLAVALGELLLDRASGLGFVVSVYVVYFSALGVIHSKRFIEAVRRGYPGLFAGE